MKNNIIKIDCNNSTITYNPGTQWTYSTGTDICIKSAPKAHQPGMFGNVYIREVIYSNPATIVLWSDNTKTVTKCAKGDKYNRETGLTLCILKKLVGPTKIHEVLENWCPQDAKRVTLTDVRKRNR